MARRKEMKLGSGREEGKNSDVNSENNGVIMRPYLRSKVPRLRWTADLHRCFVQAIDMLGGEDRATPKLILHLMDVKGVTIAHVKSHLQLHRNMRNDRARQGVVQERKRPIGNNDSSGDETKNGNDGAFEHCSKPTKESSLTPLKRSKIETKSMQKSLWFDGYKQAIEMEKRIKEANLLGDACANAFMRKCFECSDNQVCFHPFKVHEQNNAALCAQMEIQRARELDANGCSLENSGSFMELEEHLERKGNNYHGLSLSLSLNPITSRIKKSSTSESSCIISSSNGGDMLNLDLTLSIPGL